ncbi:MAG: hypothetical protein ABSG68_07620 [Thermoguttaceae bacterium]|jgi:hypothetical protein
MSTFVPKGTVGLAACAAMVVWMGILGRATSGRAAEPVVQYRDVGGLQDFDTKQNIYFDHGEGFGGTGWPRYWNMTWGGTGGALYENDEHFWWACTPPRDAQNLIGSRAIKPHHFARFRVKADKLPKEGDLFLTLRFKDEVLAPAPVFAWSGGTQWKPLGEIGGKNDHWWKTSQFRVPAADRGIEKGSLVFKIGVDGYNPSIKGELGIDAIQVATTEDRSRFPADKRGFWPMEPKSKFAKLGQSMELIPGQGPFFMFGVYDGSAGWVTDGGSQTKAGNGKMDSWRLLQEEGVNTYVIHGWDKKWRSWWMEYAGEAPSKWAAPGVYVELDIKEHVVQAAGHKLKIIPNFLTDTRAYWIQNQYKGDQQALEGLGRVMKQYADDPTLLAWYPVDEWDHEDDGYGKPRLFSHLVNLEVRKNSPNRPCFMLLMGYLGTDTWKMAAEEADILAVDAYPSDVGGIEKGLALQAERLTDMRSVMGRDKPYVLVPELGQKLNDGKGPLFAMSPAENLAQCYMGIIHGARGILFFHNHHPAEPGLPKDLWEGPTRFSRQLFGPDGLAKLLLPPSKAVDIVGESKIVKCSNPAIHASLFEDPQGRRALVALNALKKPAKGVRFEIVRLNSGQVRTRFEAGRTLSSQAGALADDFDGLQPHVYDLP